MCEDPDKAIANKKKQFSVNNSRYMTKLLKKMTSFQKCSINFLLESSNPLLTESLLSEPSVIFVPIIDIRTHLCLGLQMCLYVCRYFLIYLVCCIFL